MSQQVRYVIALSHLNTDEILGYIKLTNDSFSNVANDFIMRREKTIDDATKFPTSAIPSGIIRDNCMYGSDYMKVVKVIGVRPVNYTWRLSTQTDA